jgi:hypothetical protein
MRDVRGKTQRMRTLRSTVSVEVLPKQDWEEVAYHTAKSMSVQVSGLLSQMSGRPGAEYLEEAVNSLEKAADAILGEDHGIASQQEEML